MDLIKFALLAVILAAALVLGVTWFRHRRAVPEARAPRPAEAAVGFVTEFFDTLGIGSFAPTTAAFKLLRMVPDELIPGTLNVGHAAGVVLQSLIFITAVAVSPALLVAMVLAATVGAWFGAGVVSRLSRHAIQLGMGLALLVAGAVFAAKNLGILADGGEALALDGWKFVVATVAALVLGALMTVGIGMYAPTMIVVALLGLHPLAAFPIMMGACALLQCVAGLRFISNARFATGPALGLTLGGVPAVLLAAFVVKQLPLTTLRWLVVGVVTYAALAMLRSFARGEVSQRPAA
jgi:uncharacterized membrane protein YfcA